MKFGEKIKSKRKELGLTQEEVAKKVGISRRTYNMYEQKEEHPKHEETISKLAEVLECDVDYLRRDDIAYISGGLTSTVDMIGTALGSGAIAIGGAFEALRESIAKSLVGTYSEEDLSYSNDFMLQYARKQKQFQALSMGILISRLSEKGIQFTAGNIAKLNEIESKPDRFIVIKNQPISQWWFSFWTKDEKLDEEVLVLLEDRAALLIGRFATISTDPTRKVSIVVDDARLYNELIKFKKHNSFNGNMSIILIDSNNVEIVSEEYIATHEENADISLLSITKEGDELMR